MELVLIRHGRPERIDHDPNGADPALTPLGHQQAAAMAQHLAHETIDKIYVSPQLRALETAEPLVRVHDYDEAHVVPGVAEFDLGHTSYIPGEESGPITPDDLNGLIRALTAPDFQQRVRSSIDTIISDHPGDKIAVVCHGGVISTVLTDILGTDPTKYYDADYTSITRIRANRSGRRSMATFNESHWLRGLAD